MAEVKLIVGLGNPGREYSKTRHNLGFMAVEALAAEHGVIFGKCRSANVLMAEVRDAGRKIMLALPQTYMNNSGVAVAGIVHFEKMDLSDILVVCDDIRLAFGQMRLKLEGTDGGHNGLKSVEAHLGSRHFARLRLGVGEPPSPERQADYVLSVFGAEQERELGDFVKDAVACLNLWISGETAKAMTRYNKRKDND